MDDHAVLNESRPLVDQFRPSAGSPSHSSLQCTQSPYLHSRLAHKITSGYEDLVRRSNSNRVWRNYLRSLHTKPVSVGAEPLLHSRATPLRPRNRKSWLRLRIAAHSPEWNFIDLGLPTSAVNTDIMPGTWKTSTIAEDTAVLRCWERMFEINCGFNGEACTFHVAFAAPHGKASASNLVNQSSVPRGIGDVQRGNSSTTGDQSYA
ncbi:hypothetical protein DFH07DRAFT_516385 [Mycena maculata]|uniref:Uncharacterized protein n=1 Tax=Mycena maculata TaxID=230809 RepID=A0AAD7NBS6_9AGAR|nr:hypothetical protein DFH07DRAFT_516385 [Mycena maculata]